MTTPWEHDSHNLTPLGGGSPLGQRKKLQLKPRSVHAPLEPPLSPRSPRRSGRARAMSFKGDPFGAALPREEVLKERGIDAAKEDVRFERKAEIAHYTRDQELEIEGVRAELTKLEGRLREANEMELPEEEFRVAAESKRKELNALMKKFSDLNLTTTTSTLLPRMERPSERRSRRNNYSEENRGHHHHHRVVDDGDTDDVFASFSSNRRRRRTFQEQAY